MSSKRKSHEVNESESSEDSDAETRKKLAKKEAKRKAKPSDNSSNGDKMFSLGKKRNVNVREFKGMVLVDIREYYEDGDGNMKPGKKGISLQKGQWEALKGHIEKIDEAIKEIN